HWLMRIPTREAQISMNLGQAVAVCLYELVRDATIPLQPVEVEPASAGEIERITEVLLDALRVSGYVNPLAAAATEDKVRRLVRRLNLQSHDAELWMGMLRQIAWKIKSGN
ncbi:MAG TPA: hypothetical protein VN428_16255, partial [Bryobacteraceae bacterium]|nr:hypothetical protein [Bryobacteraceae bacterium]